MTEESKVEVELHERRCCDSRLGCRFGCQFGSRSCCRFGRKCSRGDREDREGGGEQRGRARSELRGRGGGGGGGQRECGGGEGG